MQYREEDAVYDDGTQPYYRYGRQEDVPVRSRKVRIVAVVLCVILSLSILASGILYATGNVPSFLKSGSGSTESADTASASSAPEAAPVSTPHSITLERSMLVFQLVGEDGRKNTVMEYAYDRIAAPKGPAPLTKALADKSAEIDKAFRADPEIQGQLSYDDFHNVTGFQVYQHEADIRLERADDLVVSFVQINRINHGEAEFDYTRYDAATFDVTTGEPVRLDRLIRDRDALYEAVLAVLKKDPGRENVLRSGRRWQRTCARTSQETLFSPSMQRAFVSGFPPRRSEKDGSVPVMHTSLLRSIRTCLRKTAMRAVRKNTPP